MSRALIHPRPVRACGPLRLASLLAVPAVLAGCGGGGGGGDSSPAPAPTTAVIRGSVQDPTGAAIPGYRVVYDQDTVSDPQATLTATTDGRGAYTLTVPLSDVTGRDTLTFYDTLGGLVSTQNVVVQTGGATTSVTSTVGLTPPSPVSAARPALGR